MPAQRVRSVSLQSMIVKTLLKLPEALLVKMSGGKPVTQRGHTLDPHFQFLAHGSRTRPPMSSLSPAHARAASAAGLAMLAPKPDPDAPATDTLITVRGRNIPIRVYRPRDQDPSVPVLVFYHFGGGVIGDLETCDWFCSRLAVVTRGPVVSVDYRLAPEHKWPAGIDDATDAYEWALTNARNLDAPGGRAAVGGDSMGGNFAAAISLDMRDQAKPLPAYQLLIYPAVDVVDDHPSMTDFVDAYPLSRDTMEWFMAQYLPEGVDTADLRVSPMRAMDLSGLPPALVFTAGFDPLVDQGAAYAKRLKDEGIDVQYRMFERLAHGFTAFAGASPASREACEIIAKDTAQLVSRLAKKAS